MKTFLVADKNGQKTLEAEQLATFAHYIQQVQFRFVVTKLPRANEIVLTHRDSGARVCAIPYNSLIAAAGDHVVAAKGELQKLIERVGEARVRSVLAAAA